MQQSTAMSKAIPKEELFIIDSNFENDDDDESQHLEEGEE